MNPTISPIDFVNDIPNETFHEVFINNLGRSREFSKLRCGGHDRLTDAEWGEIQSEYHKLGVPKNLTKEQMLAIAFALTARAVKARF